MTRVLAFKANGDPRWWTKIILSTVLIALLIFVGFCIDVFGLVPTAAVGLGVPATILVLTAAMGGL